MVSGISKIGTDLLLALTYSKLLSKYIYIYKRSQFLENSETRLKKKKQILAKNDTYVEEPTKSYLTTKFERLILIFGAMKEKKINLISCVTRNRQGLICS